MVVLTIPVVCPLVRGNDQRTRHRVDRDRLTRQDLLGDRTNMMKRILTAGLLLISVVLGPAVGPALAADACAEGDQKCGPDGYILRCDRPSVRFDARWTPTMRVCKGPAAAGQGSSRFEAKSIELRNVCTEGASRCGADRKVERCSEAVWRTTVNSC